MKLFEVTTNPHLYHSTSDRDAILALRDGHLNPSSDDIDDEQNNSSFVSTSTNPSLLFHAGFPDSGNIQFVFDLNNLKRLGYTTEPVDRWDEIRIVFPDGQSTFPINNQTVQAITIEDTDKRYFKGWDANIDHDSQWGQQQYQQLQKKEMSPKGEFVGNSNPFGIIKMLANKRQIPVQDKR